MRYQQDLQVALRERYRRLCTSTYDSGGHEVRLTVDWIARQPVLRSLLDEAARTEPHLDIDKFQQDLSSTHGFFRWPNRSDEGRATLVWKLMQQLADAESRGADEDLVVTYSFATTPGTNNATEAWQGFVQRVLEPIFNFLTDRIGGESSILYTLERYVRRLEWFERDDLYERATLDRQKTEEVYDTDLRRFLFYEGINMPFSQAKSASGESDVLSGLDDDDPLVCELKVFDADNRGKRVIASGVNQAIQYASDYGKNVAYVVVVNISGRLLQLPTDGDREQWPPFVELAGVRVYLITVRAKPTVSASKLGRPTPVIVSRGDLVDPDVVENVD